MESHTEAAEKDTELFFELASGDRKGILLELQKDRLHLNEIAKRLDMTSTEALRQLQRLTEARLLDKMPDGKYALTSYAKLVLEASAPMKFISKHREYFLDHDAFLIPSEFRSRLGELSQCRLVNTTIETINETSDLINGAREFLDTMIVGLHVIDEKMKPRCEEGIRMRWLMQESFAPKAPSVLSSWKRLPEIRRTPRIFGHITMTEHVVIVTLRRNDGTLSYESFIGKDDSALKWAGELFTHEWEKAKPWYP